MPCKKVAKQGGEGKDHQVMGVDVGAEKSEEVGGGGEAGMSEAQESQAGEAERSKFPPLLFKR